MSNQWVEFPKNNVERNKSRIRFLGRTVNEYLDGLPDNKNSQNLKGGREYFTNTVEGLLNRKNNITEPEILALEQKIQKFINLKKSAQLSIGEIPDDKPQNYEVFDPRTVRIIELIVRCLNEIQQHNSEAIKSDLKFGEKLTENLEYLESILYANPQIFAVSKENDFKLGLRANIALILGLKNSLDGKLASEVKELEDYLIEIQ